MRFAILADGQSLALNAVAKEKPAADVADDRD